MKTCFFSLLVLCGLILAGKGKEEQEILTISMLYNERAAAPFSEDWLIFEEYLTRKGVRFDIRLGDDGHYEEYLFAAIEAEAPPDIILKVWPEQISPYIERELILPVSDYMDDMPWFNRYIREDQLEGELDRLRRGDGKFYLLPGYQRAIQVQQWVYRKDLFRNTPATYEELFQELRYLKALYPDSTPMTACWGGAHLYAMMAAGFGITGGWAGYQSYNESTARWEFSPATDAYREMFRFLHQCYGAGLFNLDEFDQSAQDFSDRLVSNQSFFAPTWISSGLDSWNMTLRDRGIPNGDWEPLPVPESPIGIRALPPVDRFRKGLVLTTAVGSQPRISEILEFVDWAVYSPEGRELTTWGIEGKTFEKKPGGNRYLPGLIAQGNASGKVDPEGDLGLRLIFDLVENEQFVDANRPEGIVAFLNRSMLNGDTLPLDPKLSPGVIERDAIHKIEGRINAYADQSAVQFINGRMDLDEGWEEYMGELERLGYRTLEKLWNDASGK